MKTLITGGAGFIGLHLAEYLLEKGHSVDLVDNFARGVEDKDLEKVLSNEKCSLKKVDLLKADELESLGEDYNYIFHLAAIIGVQHVLNRPYDVLTQNVALLENIINLGKRQKNLKRFLFASTSEIYAGTLRAGHLEIPTPETSNLTLSPLEEPRTSYLLSKIYGEAMCHHSGLPFSIFRPHNFFGPRMGMSHVVPELLKKCYTLPANEKIIIFSPKHTRTFCYIEDAIKMIWKIAENEKCLGQYFNLGNEGPETKIIDLATIIKKVVGTDIVLEEGEETPGSPTRRCPSMKKLNSFTGIQGEVSLEEGVRRTFYWYKENVFDSEGITAQ